MSVANPLLEAALDYARRGWRVIVLHHLVDGGRCSCDEYRAEKGLAPCNTPAKHPRFSKWQESATTDAKKIRSWWAVYPQANVGVLSGPTSRQLVCDTDPRNGGDWSRAQLIQQHGGEWVADVPTCTTGGGGMHEHFAWPEGLETDQADIEPVEGFEILLSGHNVVMPPSLAHPQGHAYFWDVEPQGELPPPPAWLVELIQAALRPSTSTPASRPSAGNFPPADFARVLEGCAWLRWSKEHAASLSEPEWYAQLSIVGRCVDGEKLAHELSRPHNGYNERATAKKLEQAQKASGPRTCADIRGRLGGSRFCDACPAKVKSPIVLGMARREPPPPGPSDDEASPAAGDRVVPAETFTLLQLVERLIAEHPKPQSAHPVFEREIIQALAAAAAIDREKAIARLKAHFKALGTRGLNKAIGEARSARIRVMRSGDERPPWQTLLLRAQNGAPRGNLANAITALRHAPEWEGVLWYDEFRAATWTRKKPPIDLPAGEWENLHDTRTAAWLQARDIEVSREIAGLAVESVAYERRFHPVREYLKRLEWDKTARLDRWLRVLVGAKQDGLGEYLAAVGSKWLISAVARVMRPGCKADCALVFEGAQGIRKSSMLKALFGEEWFTDQLEEMNSKDSSMQTHGVWGIEVAELGSMSKAEVESVKSFMSRTTERYRPPYSGRLVDIPRQCVFAGTTNVQNWSRDATGARRFWPVECGAIDLPAVARERDQLWAEAYQRFAAGAIWWLETGATQRAAEEEQFARHREDPWEDLVLRHIAYLEEIAVVDLFGPECIDRPKGQRTQADQNRVAEILQRLGWRKKRASVKDESGRRTRPNVYVPTPAAKLAAAVQESLPV